LIIPEFLEIDVIEPLSDLEKNCHVMTPIKTQMGYNRSGWSAMIVNRK
jgi:hypothetical protein